MYISLRKAAALQKELQGAVPAISTSVTFSIYEANPLVLVETAAADALEAIELRGRLMSALYEIRNSVARVNITSGIHALVTELAALDNDIAFYNGLVRAEVSPTKAVIEGRIQRAQNSNPEHYSYSENVSVAVLNSANIEALKASLADAKKRKVKIQDELLELNIKHSIQLSDETVAVLTAAELL
jgi:hypothetical protein